MRGGPRTLFLAAAAALVTGAIAPEAALATPAKKAPVLTVKASPGSVATGASVTVTPTLHLPAKDKLKSYTVTFADGSKSTGTKLPRTWKHTYKKVLSGKVTVSVKDTRKHTYSASASIKVTKPKAVTSPPLPPVAAPYLAPTGVYSGRVTSLGLPIAGVVISVTDGFDDQIYASTTTDSHGNWAVATVPSTAGRFGENININSPDGFATANPAYNTVTDFALTPGIPTVYNVDLPPLAIVTGTVIFSHAALDGAEVTGCINDAAGRCAWWETVAVDSSDQYSLRLGTGMSWELEAISASGNSTSAPATPMNVPAGATAVAGPTLTLP